ncbi:MAG: hypothetical protein AAGF92_18090 [Myxococcota bacterium]
MKSIIVVVFMIGAIAAAVLTTQAEPVYAENHPHKKTQWQYQCFAASGVVQVTERANKMGQQGWELVTSAGGSGETVWCFKRPLWKK